jgi:[ribosomal protein S5]-alanine N-acetyltransferase
VPSLARLRPVEEPDLEFLQRLDTEPALSEPFEWQGFRDPNQRRRAWDKDGYLSGDYSILTVLTTGDVLAGFASWWPTAPPVRRYSCIEISVHLFPEHRGKGVGSAAHRMLADYLFEVTVAQRVEANTDASHAAERKALERAGFLCEGVMRGRRFQGGRWRDTVIYAQLRSDAP